MSEPAFEATADLVDQYGEALRSALVGDVIAGIAVERGWAGLRCLDRLPDHPGTGLLGTGAGQ